MVGKELRSDLSQDCKRDRTCTFLTGLRADLQKIPLVRVYLMEDRPCVTEQIMSLDTSQQVIKQGYVWVEEGIVLTDFY